MSVSIARFLPFRLKPGLHTLCRSVCLLIPLLAGCRSPDSSSTERLERFEFQSPHMGTLFTITLYAPEKSIAQNAAQVAFRRIGSLDEIMSDYQADSELMRLCEAPPNQPVRVSADLFDVLRQAQRFSAISDGAFDVTVGPLVRLWRFARKKKVLPLPVQINEAAASVGYNKLHLDQKARTVTLLAPNMRLDLGGIAKGYAADQALAILRGRGLTRVLVAASGDIAVGDPPPGQRGWRVSIANIDTHTNQTLSSVLLRNAGISTSGDTEQFTDIEGIRYSHIVNPRTGVGLTNRIQVTIIAPNTTTTDALATGVSVLGASRGLALVDTLPRTAAMIVTKRDGQTRVFASRRFKSIFTEPLAIGKTIP
jgi:thiamine biosynthesis lipoprotein